MNAIGRARPEVAARLLPELKRIFEADADQAVRLGAVLASSRIGTPRAVPVFVLALADTDRWLLRSSAAFGLAANPFHPEAAIGPLQAALCDRNPTIRKRVAIALAAYGQDARSALPSLVARLSDPDPDAALFSAFALEAVGGYPSVLKPVVTGLIEEGVDRKIADLRSTKRIQRWIAMRDLRRLGAPARRALPDLFQAAARPGRLSGPLLETIDRLLNE